MDPALILQAVSTAAIVGSVLFAGLQVRNAQRQRSKDAQMVLANSFANGQFMNAMEQIIELPVGLPKADVDARIDKNVVYYWLGVMESIGILVHHRQVPIELVDDFFSGPVVLSWHRLRGYIDDNRHLTGRDTMHEWFQWLAERMIERESTTPPVPAHIGERDWQA